ncbi:MAG: hypothetical protein U5S82_23160 [Gammaproteobacteria bacterium]|nr:hypothetical protein [Gammaproteobacteria bacterium]
MPDLPAGKRAAKLAELDTAIAAKESELVQLHELADASGIVLKSDPALPKSAATRRRDGNLVDPDA